MPGDELLVLRHVEQRSVTLRPVGHQPESVSVDEVIVQISGERIHLHFFALQDALLRTPPVLRDVVHTDEDELPLGGRVNLEVERANGSTEC